MNINRDWASKEWLALLRESNQWQVALAIGGLIFLWLLLV